MARSLLWISPKWLLPAQDGGRVAGLSLISSLARAGYTIDWLALAEAQPAPDPEAARKALGVRKVWILPRRSRPSGGPFAALRMAAAALLSPCIPVTLQPYAAKNVRAAMARLLAGSFDQRIAGDGPPPDGQGWDAVVYDGLHTAAHSSLIGEFRRPPVKAKIIYRAHNVEAQIWERKAGLSVGPLAKAFLAHQASVVKIFEETLVRRADAVAPVSDQDLERFRRINRSLTGVTVPIGYAFDRAQPVDLSAPATLAFIGRLDWPPNREGLEWLLKQVWPQAAARRADLSLIIAGSGEAAWLTPYLSLPRVEFLGCVPAVAPIYRRAAAVVAPIFYGGGTRVKIIEAGCYARASISTALGAEGLGLAAGTGFIRAESAEDWQAALTGFRPEAAAAVGLAAYEGLKARFSREAAAAAFGELVDRICEP